MSGFYKLENDKLLHAPNEVFSSEYTLNIKEKDKYKYPVDGWTYFDSEEEARSFFSIEPEEDFSDIEDIEVIDKKIELLEKRKAELQNISVMESEPKVIER